MSQERRSARGSELSRCDSGLRNARTSKRTQRLPGTTPPEADGGAAKDTDGDEFTWNCLASNDKGQLIKPRARRQGESDQSYFAYLAKLSERAQVGSPTVRRWELGGWKDGNRVSGDYPTLPYAGSMVLFTGWEGGRGPYDCEPLMVPVGSVVETYSAYARYAFGTAG